MPLMRPFKGILPAQTTHAMRRNRERKNAAAGSERKIDNTGSDAYEKNVKDEIGNEITERTSGGTKTTRILVSVSLII